jgi:DNA-binding winged helix-turn-helix (wHTH) protein
MPDLAEPLEFRFDNHLLDRSAGVLLRLHPDGQTSRVPLGTRAFRILCLLVERHGAIVTRQEIMDAVWPDVVVEENNLSVQLSNLRRALDADRGLGSCIQTLPGRGYRFLPAVTPSGRSLPDRAAYSCVAEDPAAANVDHAARSGDGGAGLETADTNPAGPQSEAADDATAIAAPSAPKHRRAVVITTACFCVAVLVAWFVISAPLPRTTPVAATAPATPVAAATPPVPSTHASIGGAATAIRCRAAVQQVRRRRGRRHG